MTKYNFNLVGHKDYVFASWAEGDHYVCLNDVGPGYLLRTDNGITEVIKLSEPSLTRVLAVLRGRGYPVADYYEV